MGPPGPTSTTSSSSSAATSLTTSIRQPTYFQCYERGYAVISEFSASSNPSDPHHLGAGLLAPPPNRAPPSPEPSEVEPASSGIKKSESGGFFASLFKS